MVTLAAGKTENRDMQRRTGVELDPVGAAEVILRRFAARAITMLTTGQANGSDATVHARLSANDCYAALDAACRKVARVALRRFRQMPQTRGLTFEAVVDRLFPDPAAYLARAIRSVISDEERSARREGWVDSLDRPVGSGDGQTLVLGDTVADEEPARLPEVALIAQDDRSAFRNALEQALKSIPANYLEALRRDIERERQREASRTGVESGTGTEAHPTGTGAEAHPTGTGAEAHPTGGRVDARERQTLHRARAAVASILLRECGDDNPYVSLLAKRRSASVRTKPLPATNWTGERSESLFRRLLESPWAERACPTDDSVDEAIVNDVTTAGSAAPPSPELRKSMRVLDLYTVDRPTPQTERAQSLYAAARAHREAGRIEPALVAYKACFAAEPAFIEALNEVGVMYSRLGRLRDALRVYLSIIERDAQGDHRYIAATNAADIHLTWYDAGRNRARNIELAIQYARMAMERPTPMRACNLVQALAKDRYYTEARDVAADVLSGRHPRCAPERFLQTMFQIRDADMVAWWEWLETELDLERRKQ